MNTLNIFLNDVCFDVIIIVFFFNIRDRIDFFYDIRREILSSIKKLNFINKNSNFKQHYNYNVIS